jgi:hypothetical protein
VLNKPAQPKMILSGALNQHRPSTVTAGSSSQSHSTPGNPLNGPSPNPVTGTESVKKGSASKPQRSDESQASTANLSINMEDEILTSGIAVPEDRQETCAR